MRKKSALIWATIALVVAIPATSIAGDRFSDVRSSNIFHDDIGWLADQGVTRGCNPPANDQFCPEDPVTRQQMAAFMRRFANTLEAGATPLLAGSEGTNRLLSESTWTTLDSFTINAPSGGGALLLNGTAAFFIEFDTDSGGLFILEVTIDEGCSDTSDGIAAIYDTFSVGADSATAVGSLPVSSGSHTIRLCAIAFHANTSERTDALAPRVSAMWTANGQVSLNAATASSSFDKSELLERARIAVDSHKSD